MTDQPFDQARLDAALDRAAQQDTAARLQLPDVPAYITRQQLADLCRLLGLPVDDVCAVHLLPSTLEVEVYARHPATGARYLQSMETDEDGARPVATHQLVIPVVELPPADEPPARPGRCHLCDRGGLPTLQGTGTLAPHPTRTGDMRCPGSGQTPQQTAHLTADGPDEPSATSPAT